MCRANDRHSRHILISATFGWNAARLVRAFVVCIVVAYIVVACIAGGVDEGKGSPSATSS